jgi:hypothetical protein
LLENGSIYLTGDVLPVGGKATAMARHTTSENDDRVEHFTVDQEVLDAKLDADS